MIMKPVAVLLLLFCRFISPIDIFAQERAESPAFRDGDRWRYKVVEQGEYMKTERELNGTYELVYTNRRFAIFKLEENQKQELQSGTVVLLGLVAETKNQQYLQFPLYVGKSWTTDHAFTPRRRTVDRTVTSATKIIDFGSITLGLGSFPAFKIRRDTRFRHIDHWVFTYYWSPHTRSIVKYSMEVLKGAAAGSTREIKLINFSSGTD